MEALGATEIAQRLRDPVRLARAEPTATEGHEEVGRPVAAAVLVPVVLHPSPTVLLTLRTTKLSSHAGQVAFPGGRMEPGESAEQAALREAWEEIGLGPALPKVMGRLPDHLTGTGYRVTPVVALLHPPLKLVPEPGEVDLIFEYDLKRLLDPALPQQQKARFRGRERAFWVWPHERHYVWGATAAILRNLALVLR
ncbi:CoA pyrophosphatase [Roseomonas ludipueritiae]|uniref:CoA pyrophosphatase n=1 Tax=Pseudoroseomonas ludipueritiae TaxID=198093 RepID=A0ABR7RF31_9PROT|nr:CoA pyrophosphatase [Pseudoroseomonas ludipueritiae]